jgi:gas vesicle protein
MAKLFSKGLNTHPKKPVNIAFRKRRNMTPFNRIKKARIKRRTKTTWDVAQDRLANIKDFAQSTLKTSKIAAQGALANIQESANQGLDRAQRLITTAIGIIGASAAIFYKNRQQAQEKLQRTQMSLMTSTTPIVERTQKAVRANTQKATQGLQQAKSTAKDFTTFVQDQYTHLQIKRRRRRALFRIGLIAGAILALLYTPLSGAEIRQRLNAQWQQYRGYIGI